MKVEHTKEGIQVTLTALQIDALKDRTGPGRWSHVGEGLMEGHMYGYFGHIAILMESPEAWRNYQNKKDLKFIRDVLKEAGLEP